MEERDNFLFYRSFYDATSDLGDDDRLKVYDCICEYAFKGKEPTGNGLVKTVFLLIKPLLDESYKRYISKVKNGSKGGAPKGNANAKKTTEKQPKTTENNQDNNINNNINNINNNINKNIFIGDKSPTKTTKFSPPTVGEVKAYCLERQNGIDAERFVDYYTAHGWQVGKSKMKDWKAAVRTWEKNNNSTAIQESGEETSAKKQDFKYGGIIL